MDWWQQEPTAWRSHAEARRRQAVKVAQDMYLAFVPPLAPYHEELLASARRLISDGHPQATVLVAHMACEVFIGQVIVRLMERRGLEDAKAWAEEYKEGFSFGNPAIRALYFSLSKERISKTFPRWKEYDQHVQLRNRVAHRGDKVTPEEAARVCEVAEKLAAHLRATLEEMK
jgi:hypothetical protein